MLFLIDYLKKQVFTYMTSSMQNYHFRLNPNRLMGQNYQIFLIIQIPFFPINHSHSEGFLYQMKIRLLVLFPQKIVHSLFFFIGHSYLEVVLQTIRN